MTCRKCGIEIADKAIVCYRCGTPTAEVQTVHARRRPGRDRWMPLILVVALIVAAVVWSPHGTNRVPYLIAVAVIVVLVAAVFVMSRGRRQGLGPRR